jgi:hypothetical protein
MNTLCKLTRPLLLLIECYFQSSCFRNSLCPSPLYLNHSYKWTDLFVTSLPRSSFPLNVHQRSAPRIIVTEEQAQRTQSTILCGPEISIFGPWLTCFRRAAPWCIADLVRQWLDYGVPWETSLLPLSDIIWYLADLHCILRRWFHPGFWAILPCGDRSTIGGIS